VAQPPEVDAAASELVALFELAQKDIAGQLAELAHTGAAGAAKRRRLRRLERTVETTLDGLERDAAAWLRTRLPAIYQLGASTAAGQLGQTFTWTQPHSDAVTALARRTWDDLLSATRYVRESTKAWIRAEARRGVALALIEGRTPEQARAVFLRSAGDVAEALGGDVFTVRYRNGAAHTLRDYADTLVRTETAKAYNAGSINTAGAAGITHMECADGFDCGLVSHDDTEKPNGKIYPIAQAASYSLAHPRCQRAWLPRPDVSAATASRAASLRPASQIADQAANDQRRRDAVAARAQRRARQLRQARTPRRPRRAA